MGGLSVIIPAYNEESGIAQIASRVLAVGPALRAVGVAPLEVLVVDDGSRDRTAEIAEALEGVRVIRHTRNRGYGAALKTGFRHARADLLGFLDADGTYPPESFPGLCTEAINGAELVIGSRMAGARSKMPVTRRLGNLFFAGLLTLLGNRRVTDSASGMRVFRRQILERLYPLPDGLNLTPVMSVRALHEGIRMTEVPITYDERVGRSKLSVVRDGSTFLQSILWTAMSYNPARILGLLGLLGVGFSSLVGLGLVIARLQGVTELRAWGVAALYGGMVSAVVGISLFGLGVAFNYLVILFHGRPVEQGLFGRRLLNPPIEHHFGWIGLVMLVLGAVVAGASLLLGIRGWEVVRLWFYLLGSALLALVGIQMIILWILLRVLEELSRRDMMVMGDLNGAEVGP